MLLVTEELDRKDSICGALANENAYCKLAERAGISRADLDLQLHPDYRFNEIVYDVLDHLIEDPDAEFIVHDASCVRC